jgi:3',5'-nucleoside bisphosphate phosphatase
MTNLLFLHQNLKMLFDCFCSFKNMYSGKPLIQPDMFQAMRTFLLVCFAFTGFLIFLPEVWAQEPSSVNRTIEFPDIPGYLTLKCDFHMHTVLSDGYVWPSIRVEEALRDGLDAISLTEHLEYQPHRADIPHPDRNRSLELAQQAARGKELIIIHGAEITRSMPPGHANAIFLEDANALNRNDVMEVFQEAKRQGAFVFWNHPNWTAQRPDGMATLTDMHRQLMDEGLITGIEIVNEDTYSEEALQIALDHNLTLMGCSDIHGLIDWHFDVPAGGHRPVTLVFARERTGESVKEALQARRTAVWFDNTLVGREEFLVPLLESSLEVERKGSSPVQPVVIRNNSDATLILENRSDFTLHEHAGVLLLEPHRTTTVHVKTLESLDRFELRFGVLNAVTAPGRHPEISIIVD